MKNLKYNTLMNILLEWMTFLKSLTEEEMIIFMNSQMT